MKKNDNPPNLKSASGSGFSFEDKVTALLFGEMLAGKSSLGPNWGVIERVEHQAGDWEPFGDLLLIVPNREGKSAKCGCSVKSNRQVNTNGCSAELRDGFWRTIGKPVFNQQLDSLGLFCAELSNDVSPVLNLLCRQAGEEERPQRLQEKITDQKHRKIYESFRQSSDAGEAGLLTDARTLRDGVVPVRADAYRERLLWVKRGEIPSEQVDSWRKELHHDFESALAETKLPERPDYEKANRFLVNARRIMSTTMLNDQWAH